MTTPREPLFTAESFDRLRATLRAHLSPVLPSEPRALIEDVKVVAMALANAIAEPVLAAKDAEIEKLTRLTQAQFEQGWQASRTETALRARVNALTEENTRLKRLTTEPDHGNEYSIVCHYKNEMDQLRAQLALAKEALTVADDQMDYYHGLPMRPEILEPKPWEDVHRKVRAALQSLKGQEDAG